MEIDLEYEASFNSNIICSDYAPLIDEGRNQGA
jgi:hypothetical protein